MKIKHKLKTLAVASALAGAFASPAHAVPVALELALLIDVSGSVITSEYNLQKTGYVDAFNNATVQNAISSLTGGIAVTYIEWSSSNQQATLVGWTHVTDAASSSAFATAIQGTTRAFSGGTAPGAAIAYADPLFDNNGFEGSRWVMDVSGDGTGESTTDDARDAFLAGAPNGVTAAINGLCIGGTTICNWYQANIVGGTNAFLVAASDFNAFGNAIVTKLGREISNDVPVPATAALIGIGLIAVGAARRRKTD